MAEVNLNEFNDKSLDILADIFDPYTELMKDAEFVKLFSTNTYEAIKYACKAHKKEVIKIAAVLNGVPEEEYVVNPFTLPITLFATIGAYSKINASLFTSYARNTEEASSGSATENTEASDQPKNF